MKSNRLTLALVVLAVLMAGSALISQHDSDPRRALPTGGTLTGGGGGGLTNIVTTSDLAGTGSAGSPLGIANTGVSVGTYTSATITVNPGGRITAATSNPSVVPFAEFGTGYDGACTMDGSASCPGFTLSGSTYTATREVALSQLTVNSGVVVKLQGWPLRVKGLLTNNGKFDSNGSNASGSTGGVAPYDASGGVRILSGGGNGGAGNGTGGQASNFAPQIYSSTVAPGGGSIGAGGNGTDGGIGHGGGGGGGGDGTDGGVGGGVTRLDATEGDVRGQAEATFMAHSVVTRAQITGCTGGGAGGNGGNAGAGAFGAGGGAAAPMSIAASSYAGTGTYEAKGGNGGNGGNGVSGNGSGGGGGGGGAGCLVVFITGSGSPPTAIVTGGTGGAGGTPFSGGSGTAGGHGGNGGSGAQLNF